MTWGRELIGFPHGTAPYASNDPEDGDWGRDVALYLGRRMGRLTLRELGARAGGLDDTTTGAVVSRMARRVDHDARLRRQLERIKRELSFF